MEHDGRGCGHAGCAKPNLHSFTFLIASLSLRLSFDRTRSLTSSFLATISLFHTFHPFDYSMSLISKSCALAALALSSLAASSTAQFVRAPTDLTENAGGAGVRIRFKEVPAGICETRSNVKSYSGFVDIGPNQHIYFQFFEARKGDAKKAPLSM